MEKSIIEDFETRKFELTYALLEEIKEEYKSYKKECVEIPYDEYEELYDLAMYVEPLIMDHDCQIDGTAMPYCICHKDEELVLYVVGANCNPDYDYLSLENIEWGWSVKGLYHLLLVLKHPLMKKENGCL